MRQAIILYPYNKSNYINITSDYERNEIDALHVWCQNMLKKEKIFQTQHGKFNTIMLFATGI